MPASGDILLVFGALARLEQHEARLAIQSFLQRQQASGIGRSGLTESQARHDRRWRVRRRHRSISTHTTMVPHHAQHRPCPAPAALHPSSDSIRMQDPRTLAAADEGPHSLRPLPAWEPELTEVNARSCRIVRARSGAIY
jgi:hypothetical protein